MGIIRRVLGRSRSSIPEREIKILFALSGGICAFHDCNKPLIAPGTTADGPVIVGEMAHIIAESRQGPRGIAKLSDEERNSHKNLILVCPDHHKVIDSQLTTYSVAVLRQMKYDHELRVQKATCPQAQPAEPQCKKEELFSTLLPVTHLPRVVFCAPCTLKDATDGEIKKLLDYSNCKGQLVPFYLAGNLIMAFQDLRDPQGPFASLIDIQRVEVLNAIDLWKDPEGQPRYVALLNRSLYKYAARLHVRYDPEHHRFYFEADEPGKVRRVRWRTLNGKWSTRRVVWRPTRRKTGEMRNFWWHLAAGLRFHHVADNGWCVSVRPERHITKDGETPFPPEEVGRRVTRLKAHMYNGLYLAEICFWLGFLAKGQPRIILNFGSQSAIIQAQFIRFRIAWPGIAEDERVVRSNQGEEDLFSFAEFEEALSGEDFDSDDSEEDDETE